MQTIYTIGHSTHPAPEFIDMLRAFDIRLLVDIRTVPRSRHNPQFGTEALEKSLAEVQIGYCHMKELGGLRKTHKDSINGGWRNASFRGYADYMQTAEFKHALEQLIALSQQQRTAIMCAEAVPWRCHRSLVADALSVRGVPVKHIMSKTNANDHHLTKFANVKGTNITYPPEKDLFSRAE